MSAMEKLLRRLAFYVDLSDAETALLQDLPHKAVSVKRGEDIVREGDPTKEAFVVRRGWAIRFAILEDGRRQVLNILLPGDVFDLQVLVAKEADHSVAAVTDCDLFTISPRNFAQLFYESGSLGLALWWTAVQEEAILREQIVRNGRRSGAERLSHFLLELHRRCEVIGEGGDDWFRLPITQTVIADTLGLTNVYTNRLLKQLEARDFIKRTSDGIDLLDMAGMKELSDFDAAYLHLRQNRKLLTNVMNLHD